MPTDDIIVELKAKGVSNYIKLITKAGEATKKAGDDAEQLQDTLSGNKASKGVKELTKDVKKLEKELKDVGDTTSKAFDPKKAKKLDVQLDVTKKKLGKLTSAFKGFGIAAGAAFVTGAAIKYLKVLSKIANETDGVSNKQKELKQIYTSINSEIADELIPTYIKLLDIVIKNADGFTEFIRVQKNVETRSATTSSIVKILSDRFNVLKDILNNVSSFFSNIIKLIGSVGRLFGIGKDNAESFGSALELISKIGSLFEKSIRFLTSAASKFIENITKGVDAVNNLTKAIGNYLGIRRKQTKVEEDVAKAINTNSEAAKEGQRLFLAAAKEAAEKEIAIEKKKQKELERLRLINKSQEDADLKEQEERAEQIALIAFNLRESLRKAAKIPLVDIPTLESVFIGDQTIENITEKFQDTSQAIATLQSQNDKKTIIEKVSQAQSGFQEIAQIQSQAFNIASGFIQNEEIALENRLNNGLISEKKYLQEKAALQNKQAKADKANAIFQATLNLATGITSALKNPLTAPFLIPIITALGIAQIAQIASQPIPQFKDGIQDFGGGLAVVGDGGKREPITDKKGNVIGVSPNKPTLVNLPKGANVFSSESDFINQMLKDGVPMQYNYNSLANNLEMPNPSIDSIIKDKIKSEAIKSSLSGINLNPLLSSNDQSRFYLGKKLDKLNNSILDIGKGRKMTAN